MNWPPDIADELPFPRDDEPSSLRQDIADELADHLHSSFVRELHRTPEEIRAQQQVLDRFGDPRRVARQLWFDAMKEKIMSQRVNLTLSSLMTLACLGALGVMTMMLRDSREVNAAILERLQALAVTQPAPAATPSQPAVEPFKSLDWVPAKFQLVLDKEGRPPAIGFKVQLQNFGKDSQVLGETVVNGSVVNGMLEVTTGADGMADLGLCRFGVYHLTVISPWGEQFSRQFSLRPGPDSFRELKCPAAAPEQVDVAFSVDWPDDLKDRELWLICNYGPANRRISAESWTMGVPGYGFYGSANNTSTRDVLVINSHGESAIQRATSHRPSQGMMGGMGGGGMEGGWFDFVTPVQFIGQQQLPAMHNMFATLSVVNSRQEEGAEHRPVLASVGGMGMGGMGGGMGGGYFDVAGQGITTGAPGSLSFEAKPGQVNQWKIRLSEYVLDQVRIKLKLKSDPAAVVEPTDDSADDSETEANVSREKSMNKSSAVSVQDKRRPRSGGGALGK